MRGTDVHGAPCRGARPYAGPSEIGIGSLSGVETQPERGPRLDVPLRRVSSRFRSGRSGRAARGQDRADSLYGFANAIHGLEVADADVGVLLVAEHGAGEDHDAAFS